MADRLSERLKAITRRISDHLFSDEVSTLHDAAELDRREAIVRAAEEWAKLIRASPSSNAVAFYHAEETLLALLPAAALKG